MAFHGTGRDSELTSHQRSNRRIRNGWRSNALLIVSKQITRAGSILRHKEHHVRQTALFEIGDNLGGLTSELIASELIEEFDCAGSKAMRTKEYKMRQASERRSVNLEEKSLIITFCN